MKLENKIKITQNPRTGIVIIEVTSNGHPLDEVIRLMVRGMNKGTGLKQ